ncbi:hypothetical protein M3Y95_00398700 [Aphelenchoides besseyi]|nr:hypothetical protein M3Y95_00398700 [Aphelenchoides besseyi]
MGSCCSTIVYQGEESTFSVKKEKMEVNHHDFEHEFHLTDKQKQAMQTCWKTEIAVNRRDICHKTMLFCIEASPKLNEIIACGRYCFRDLTKWPKLNEMCQKKFEFFDRLIVDLNLDEGEIAKEAHRTGRTHAEYSKFGLKPHFLDIFQQQFIGILFRLKETEAYDKQDMISGFTIFLSYIIDCMNSSYAQAISSHRLEIANQRSPRE